MSDMLKLDDLSPEELAKIIKEAQGIKRQKVEEARAAKPMKRGRGIMEFTKRTHLEYPDISNDELYQLLSDNFEGASRSVMETCRSDFKHSLKVLGDMGRLKELDEVEPEPEEEEVVEEFTPRRRRHAAE